MSEQLNTFDDVQDPVVEDPKPEGGAGVADPDPNQDPNNPDVDPGSDDDPKRQPPEVNHQFAEFRKSAQTQIGQLTEQIGQKDQLTVMLFETAFKGEINPYTQRPIETIEDFIAWKEEDDKKQLEKAGLSPDYLKQMIANDPTVKQAAAILEHNQQIQQKFAVDTEIAEIQKINPSIKSLDDLAAKMKDNDEFNAMVNGGMSLSRAYAAVHKVPQRKQDDTKNHLQSIGGGNAGNATEPPIDVVKEYQKWNPRATMDEIRAHWAKSHGGNKK